MIYKNRLRYLKEMEAYNQDDMANIIGIKRSNYSHYETEDRILPLKYLNTFCNHFNVSIDYIMGFNNTKQYNNNSKEIDIRLFGTRFKAWRKENKKRQITLADELNASKSIISDYEKGKVLVSTEFLYNLCNNYNLSADYLLGKIDYNPLEDNNN